MAKQFPALLAKHRSFIGRQPVFFVASAAGEGRINLSPKGLDPLRVIDDRTVCYLDRTGSGAEVAAHLGVDGRLTLMLCAFAGPPLILRLYGRGESLRRGGADYDRLLAEVFGGAEPPGARQIVRLDIDLVQTSCGFGVPLMDPVGERPSLDRWAEAQGEEGLAEYRRAKNALSLDGLPTGLVE